MVVAGYLNMDKVSANDIFKWLSAIPDPEVPVINIAELGVLRQVYWDNETLHVEITPTYSGCPAMFAIESEIKSLLQQKGLKREQILVKTVFTPAWTTDWLSDEAKKKLLDYGIAPPHHSSKIKNLSVQDIPTKCPFCGSENTKLTSWFGSTACKALYYCNQCNQPFEHFKCLH
mgnify:CR=1 FL=1